jgi:hypothetical protein
MDPYELKYFDRWNIDHRDVFRWISSDPKSAEIFNQIVEQIDEYHATSRHDDKGVSTSSYMDIYSEIIHAHCHILDDTALSANPDV